MRGWLHFAAIWLLVRVCGRLPARLLAGAADVLGTVAWFASRRLRRVTGDHMRHVLGPYTPRWDRDRAARGCVRTTARYYADFARGPYVPPGSELDRLVAADGIDRFFDAFDHGCGVIVVSAHVGNPEFILRAVAHLGLPLMAVTERLHPPRLDALVGAVRRAPGARLVAADVAGARAALEHLRAGGVLALLADRDVTGSGRAVTFFGERARLPVGVVELALRTGAPVIPAFVLREGDRLRLAIDPPLALPRSGDREGDLAAGMRLLAAALEAGIRRAPDQWFALSPVWSGLAL